MKPTVSISPTQSQCPSLTGHDHLEAFDRVLEWDELALRSREHLGHLEGLTEETLHLTGARHDKLVLLRQLVHTKDSDDVLQGLVVLQKYQY